MILLAGTVVSLGLVLVAKLVLAPMAIAALLTFLRNPNSENLDERKDKIVAFGPIDGPELTLVTS
jgi:hypothetical protein